MPRESRIDAPGALYHIIFSGLEQRNEYAGHRTIMEKISREWQGPGSNLDL